MTDETLDPINPTGAELKTVVVQGNGRSAASESGTHVHRMPINSTTMGAEATQPSSMVQVARFGLVTATLVLAFFAYKSGTVVMYVAAGLLLVATAVTFFLTRSKTEASIVGKTQPGVGTVKPKGGSKWSRTYWVETYEKNPSKIGDMLKGLVKTCSFWICLIWGLLWFAPLMIYTNGRTRTILVLFDGGQGFLIPLIILGCFAGISMVLHKKGILVPDKVRDPQTGQIVSDYKPTVFRTGMLITAVLLICAWFPSTIKKIYDDKQVVQIRKLTGISGLWNKNSHSFYTPPETYGPRPTFGEYIYFLKLEPYDVNMKSVGLSRYETACKMYGHPEVPRTCFIRIPRLQITIDLQGLVELNNKNHRVKDLREEELFRIGVILQHLANVKKQLHLKSTGEEQDELLDNWFAKAIQAARNTPFGNVSGLSKPFDLPVHVISVHPDSEINIINNGNGNEQPAQTEQPPPNDGDPPVQEKPKDVP